jgi:hypothetical protein
MQFIQFCFVEDWYWATKGIPELNWEPCRAADGRENALVIDSGPADRLETCGLMYDSFFIKEVETMLSNDFARSHPCTMDDYIRRSFFFKLAVRSARLLAPIL